MTNPTAEISAIAERSQSATVAAVRTWMDTLRDYASSVTPEHPFPKPVDLQVAVNTYFDLASRLLDEQRKLVKVVVEAGSQLGDTLTEQVRTATSTVPATAPHPTVPAHPAETPAPAPQVVPDAARAPKPARTARTDKP